MPGALDPTADTPAARQRQRRLDVAALIEYHVTRHQAISLERMETRHLAGLQSPAAAHRAYNVRSFGTRDLPTEPPGRTELGRAEPLQRTHKGFPYLLVALKRPQEAFNASGATLGSASWCHLAHLISSKTNVQLGQVRDRTPALPGNKPATPAERRPHRALLYRFNLRLIQNFNTDPSWSRL